MNTHETNDDPVQHADVGETVTLRESRTLRAIDMVPKEYFGSDRQTGEVEIADIELVDRGELGPDIRVTWSADVTKQLPEDWDYHRDPLTAEQEQQQRRQKWIDQGIQAVATIIPVGIAFVVALNVTNGIAGMTINGEPLQPPSMWSLAPAFAALVILTALIMYGIQGRFPGTIHGGRR